MALAMAMRQFERNWNDAPQRQSRAVAREEARIDRLKDMLSTGR